MAFTPGPWEVEDWLPDGEAPYVVSRSADRVVCDMIGNEDEDWDNARLIAAARDLLAACHAALYLLGRDAGRATIGAKPWAPHGAESVPEILRAAIAKAKGQEE